MLITKKQNERVEKGKIEDQDQDLISQDDKEQQPNQDHNITTPPKQSNDPAQDQKTEKK